MKNTKSDPVWKETIGKKGIEKGLKTISDPVWKETVGKEKYKKQSESLKKTKSDPVWKEKNSKLCVYCNKKMYIGNYVHSHGDKCRHKPLTLPI